MFNALRLIGTKAKEKSWINLIQDIQQYDRLKSSQLKCVKY